MVIILHILTFKVFHNVATVYAPSIISSQELISNYISFKQELYTLEIILAFGFYSEYYLHNVTFSLSSPIQIISLF